MSFCDVLLKENQDIIKGIERMPFITEMYNGTLSDERFFYYIEQDIHYLNDFARANAFLLTRSTNDNMISFFLDAIRGTFKEQENVHKKYTTLPNYEEKGTFTRAYKNYTKFLLHHTSTSYFPLGYISTVPCPWLYVHLGRKFSNKEFENDKYKYWFLINSSEEAEIFLSRQLELLENLAKEHPIQRNDMKALFREALLFEYAFWSDAYDLVDVNQPII